MGQIEHNSRCRLVVTINYANYSRRRIFKLTEMQVVYFLLDKIPELLTSHAFLYH